jgi:hypothetical protein
MSDKKCLLRVTRSERNTLKNGKGDIDLPLQDIENLSEKSVHTRMMAVSYV